MTQIEIVDKNKDKLFPKYNERYRIIESHSYRIDVFIDGILTETTIDVNGLIDEYGCVRTIKAGVEGRFFINCLGCFTLSIGGKPIAEIEAVSCKLENVIASKLFDFVYRKNSLLFDGFLNKQKDFNRSNTKNNEVSLTEYLFVIKSITDCYMSHLKSFKNKPIYKLKPEVLLSNYNEKNVTGKSIEWIFQNLDELSYGDYAAALPGVFQIDDSFAVPQKIQIEKKGSDYDVYENQVILGVVNRVVKKINEILNSFHTLTSDDLGHTRANASFNSIKRTIITHEIDTLLDQRKTLLFVKSNLLQIFKKVKINEARPRLTQNFRKEKHYGDVYHKFQIFLHTKFSGDGLKLALGIRNLDKLYELYVLYQLADCFALGIGQTPQIIRNGDKIDYFQFKSNGCTTRIYYDYKIEKYDVVSKYPWFRLFNNSAINTHYKPDFVIEHQCPDVITRYAILDAKYTTGFWIGNASEVGYTTQNIIGKYFFSISHRDDLYVKCDYICLLYPSDEKSLKFTNENRFFPKVMSIPIQPDNEDMLRELTRDILRDWNIH